MKPFEPYQNPKVVLTVNGKSNKKDCESLLKMAHKNDNETKLDNDGLKMTNISSD